MPEPKEWRQLIRNNSSNNRLVSIPWPLINKAGFEDYEELEGRWSVWQTQGRVLVLEIREKNEVVD